MNSLYLKATKSVMYWRSEADRLDKRAVRWQSACAVSLVFNAIFLAWLLGPANHSNRWSLGPFRVIAGTMSHMPGDLYDQPPAPSGGWDMCAHDTEYWACFDWPGPALKIENGVGLDTTPPPDEDEVDPFFGSTTDQFQASMIPGNQSPQEPPSVKAGVTGWNRQPSTLYSEILVDMVDASAHLCGLDRDRWRRLVTRESDWRPNVRGGKGKDAAWGLAQIKPSTLRGVSSRLDPTRPWDRLVGAACYLRQMYDRETTGTEEERWTRALHSYRVGPRGERTEGVKAYANWIMGEAQ